MLILAGVSINAIVGEDGVLTKAQNTTYLQSCAILQEYLEMYYASNFDNMDETTSRLSGLLTYGESKKWFWKPSEHGYGMLNYIVNSEGKVCYLIDKDELPEDIKTQIKGGNAGSKTYQDYYQMNDVYGVTDNLTVYYCANGFSSILCSNLSELPEEDMLREVFSPGSELANIITGGNEKGVTLEDLKTVKELTITGESGLKSLKEFYNLQSLTKLILKDIELESLNGIEEAYQLKQVYFKNCKIGDYSALNKMNKRLTHLYCYIPPTFEDAQNEVDKLLSFDKGILNGEFEKLSCFGIFGNTTYIDNQSFSWYGKYAQAEITNVSNLQYMQDVSKKAMKRIYLCNTKITDISCLADYSNVEYLAVSTTEITTLNGMQNMNSLVYLAAEYTKLGYNESEIKNVETDALSYIQYNSSPSISIQLDNSPYLKYTSYLENLNIASAYIRTCESLDLKDLGRLTDLYIDGHITVDTINGIAFNNDIRLDFYNNGTLTNTCPEISKIEGNTDLLYLRLDGQNGLTDNVAIGQKTLTDILSTCTNLKTLSLRGITGLSSIEFVRYMPNLVELDLYDCTNINDLSLLETLTNDGKLNLETLRINNKNIDITKIQNTISNLDGTWKQNMNGEMQKVSHTSKTFLSGSVPLYFVATTTIYKQLSNCNNITQLYFRYCGPSTIDLSKMTSLKLIDIYGGSGTWTLPDNLETLRFKYGKKLIAGLSENSKLKSASIECSGLTNDYLKQYFLNFSNCKELETLTLKLRDSKITELDMSDLKNSNIKTLTLSKYTSSELVSLTGLGSNLGGVTTLTISSFDKLKTISGLKDMNSLETLKIYNTLFSDLTEIGELTTLTELKLNNNAIASLKPLESLTNLTVLDLSYNNITDRSAYVDTSNNKVQYSNIDVLFSLNKKKLSSLNLDGNTGILDDSKIASLVWEGGYSFNIDKGEETSGIW